MQAIDKLKSDFDDWTRRAGPNPSRHDLDSLRMAFSRAIGPIPQETISAVFANFLALYGSDGPRGSAKAVEWLGGIGSLFLMDYDGTPFTREEWAEIEELATVDSGEIDMEVLSYILAQVLEHGAL